MLSWRNGYKSLLVASKDKADFSPKNIFGNKATTDDYQAGSKYIMFPGPQMVPTNNLQKCCRFVP